MLMFKCVIMKDKEQVKMPTTNAEQKKPDPSWTDAQKKEMQSILNDEKEVEETRKILTDKIDKLMERGEKLDDLAEKAKDLEDEATVFKEYSLFMSWIGTAVGFVAGLLAGYAWPMALLIGGTTGLAFYATMRVFTSLNQYVDNAAQKISPYLPPTPFSNVSDNSIKSVFLPRFKAAKAKVVNTFSNKADEKPSNLINLKP